MLRQSNGPIQRTLRSGMMTWELAFLLGIHHHQPGDKS